MGKMDRREFIATGAATVLAATAGRALGSTGSTTERKGTMKAILINGSRRERGCTYTALMEVAKTLNEAGVETELFYVGKAAADGTVEEMVDRIGAAAKDADALVVGSPVYYASPSGEVQMVLDRLFMRYGKDLAFKPAAAVASARRAGTTATLDVLNKYFTINQMPVVSSRYWNIVHGNMPDEVRQDLEGMMVMRTLGRNMAWLMKSIAAGRAAGLALPEQEPQARTNFIR